MSTNPIDGNRSPEPMGGGRGVDVQVGSSSSETQSEKASASSKLGEAIRWLLLLVVASIVAFTMIDRATPVKSGDAPAISMSSYDGRTWDASMFPGKVLFLNFWATWCPPCLQEIPELMHFQEAHGDKAIVVGVSVDSPDREVMDVIKRYQINYPITKAAPRMVRDWNATSLPTTVVLNAQREVVWSTVGAVNQDVLENVLGDILAAPQATLHEEK